MDAKATALFGGELHIGVSRPTATLGGNPNNVLRWIFDVTCLAVHTILSIDLQPGRVVRVGDVLINACRAVASLGSAVDSQVGIDRHRCIFKR